MTLDEAIAKLEASPRDWYLTRTGEIRRISARYGTDRCPYLQLWDEGCDTHGLSCIWPAADNQPQSPYFDPALRSRLLAACGLDPAAKDKE